MRLAARRGCGDDLGISSARRFRSRRNRMHSSRGMPRHAGCRSATTRVGGCLEKGNLPTQPGLALGCSCRKAGDGGCGAAGSKWTQCLFPTRAEHQHDRLRHGARRRISARHLVFKSTPSGIQNFTISRAPADWRPAAALGFLRPVHDCFERLRKRGERHRACSGSPAGGLCRYRAGGRL